MLAAVVRRVPTAALLGLLGSTAAIADSGPYVSARAGAAFPVEQDTDLASAPALNEIGYDVGLTASGSAGYALETPAARTVFDRVRLEGEALYFANDNDELENGGTEVSFGDETTALGGMANVLFDFGLPAPSLEGYFGLGVGLLSVDVEGATPSGIAVDDDDSVFAWQGRVGVDYSLTDRVSVNAGYRFLGTEGVDVRTAAGASLSIDQYQQHVGEVGLRYRF